MAAKAWEEYLRRNRSVIVDLFQGQLQSSLRCKECKYCSIKFDIFMFLSIPIPDHIERPTLH
jgi:ubiquitin carboxyl-terminal hydrolase 8